MVRRLKADLRRLGEAFPERRIERIADRGPARGRARARSLAPARRLWRAAQCGASPTLPRHKAALAKLAFVGLQQRLLSSIAAFARTLKVHRKTLAAAARRRDAAGRRRRLRRPSSTAARRDEVDGPRISRTRSAKRRIDADEDATAEAASVAGAADASQADLRQELAAVDDMLALAEQAARRPDARVHWLVRMDQGQPAVRRDAGTIAVSSSSPSGRTRAAGWRRRLREALADTDRADERIGVFTGATGQDRREEVKRAFNADPAKEPLRILICTDAAREGINLQTYCSDLIHFDLPWNPSRLEQRNGRIDRKLQPAKQVVLPLFPLRAARGRHRARCAGAQDRDDPRASSAPPAR